MKLQDQVCTLEQAKRIKELGVVQGKSAFAFIKNKCHDEIKFRLRMVLMEGVSYEGYEDWEGGCLQGYSAFTVAELGEMLPDYLTVDSYRMHPRFYKQEQNNSPALWTATYGNSEDKDVPDFDFNNEAHCRAALLIWLIESNLTTIEQINKLLTQ